MAKRKLFKVGEQIVFHFAGGPITGVIESVDKTKAQPKYKVTDGKYKYPVDHNEVVQ